MAHEVVHLIFRRVVCQALQELGEVFLAIEVVAALRGVVQIPGRLFQLLKGGQELRRLAQWRREALDHFLASETLHGVDRSREAGGQQQRAYLGSGFLAGLQIDHLRVCRGIAVPEVLGDDIAHAGDLGELVAHLLNPEVEVLRADEKDVIGLALPDRAQERRETSSIKPRVCLNCSFSLNRATTFFRRGWNG